MNENINLTEILKDCPKGTKLYTPLFGEVYFNCVMKHDTYPIDIYIKEDRADHLYFTKEGLYHDLPNCECILFPSKDQRDWGKFKCTKPKFDPKTLKPFDKVLVRDFNDKEWIALLFSHFNANKGKANVAGCVWKQTIPYNEDTKHLVGTTEEAPEYYRYWEE